MPAQSRKSVPSRTPGMVRVRDSASRSRLQSPSRKRNEADARKASDRSRLQAPKSAASKARSKAAMNKKITSAFKNLQAARPKRRLTRTEPAMPELRPILLKPARRPIKGVPRIGESRSRLRRS